MEPGVCQLWIDVIQPYAAPFADRAPRLTHAAEELGVMLQPVLEPVVLVLEPDENTSRLAVTRNYDLRISGHAEIA